MYLLVFYSFKILLLNTGPNESTVTSISVFAFMIFIEKALAAILVPLIVHTDPAAGGNSQWMTRPVSGKMLFAVKMSLVLGLLLLLPLLGECIHLILNGTGFKYTLIALAETAVAELGFILPLVLLAVLTPNFSRYALVGALPLFAALILYFSPQIRTELLGSLSQTLYLSKMLVLDILIISIVPCIIYYQYKSRNTKRAVILSLSMLILFPVVWGNWNLDFSRQPPVLTDQDPLVKNLIVAPGDSIRHSEGHGQGYSFINSFEGSTYCYLVPGQYLLYLDSHSNIHLTDKRGADFPLYGREIDNRQEPIDFDVTKRDALSHMLEGAAIFPEPERQDTGSDNMGYRFGGTMLEVKEPQGTRSQFPVPLTYSADARFSLIRLKDIGRLPLDEGAAARIGEDSIKITGKSVEGNTCEIKLHMDIKNLFLAGSVNNPYKIKVKGPGYHPFVFQWGFVLHNPVTEEAILPKSIEWNYIRIPPILKTNCWFAFKIPQTDTEQWLKNAKMVVYRAEKNAGFSKSFCIENLDLNDTRLFPPDNDERNLRHRLEKIRLPKNPTSTDIRSYIGNIMALDYFREGNHDPRIAKLAQIGKKHLPILARIGYRFHDNRTPIVTRVIKQFAGAEDKELILSVLPHYPGLIETVSRFGWIMEAKPQVLKRLAGGDPVRIHRETIRAAISYNDPSFHADLYRVLNERSAETLATLYPALKKLPGFDLQKLIRNAWLRFRYDSKEEVCFIMPLVLEYGNIDALAIGVRLYASHALEKYDQLKLEKALSRFTAYTGKMERIREWFDRNKHRLHFEAVQKKFRVSPRAPRPRD